jgi:hypothetical protein
MSARGRRRPRVLLAKRVASIFRDALHKTKCISTSTSAKSYDAERSVGETSLNSDCGALEVIQLEEYHFAVGSGAQQRTTHQNRRDKNRARLPKLGTNRRSGGRFPGIGYICPNLWCATSSESAQIL